MRMLGGPLLLACWMASATFAKTDRFVWTNSPAPAAPYTNWLTAARTIQAAVDVCENGDTVVVTNGLYDIGGRTAPFRNSTNRVMVTNTILVRSVNGPKETVIRGQGPQGASAVRCAYLTNGATLSGFRLENGHTPGHAINPGDEDPVGGGAILSADCRLFDCVIVGNAAATQGGGVYGYSGATVEACTLDDNSAEDGGGVYLEDGILLDSTFRDNVASPGYGGGARAIGGGVTNCTFVRNNGYWGGGLMIEGGSVFGLVAVSNVAAAGAGIAASESELDDCRLSFNSALNWGGGAYLSQSFLAHSVVSNNDLAWQQEAEPLPGHGAGIACDFGWVHNCEIVANWGNHPDDVGGGIAASGDDFFPSQIIDCSIRGNSAGRGGGLYIFPESMCLAGGQESALEFLGNVASNFGGGICVSTQSVLIADGPISVETNWAADGGGLAALEGAQILFEAANALPPPTFCGNVATNNGGGIYATGSTTTLTLTGVRFGQTNDASQGNVALGNANGSGGGGIALYHGTLEGTELSFAYNRCAFRHGGAILLDHAQATLTSAAPSDSPATAQPACRFLVNQATNNNGGAVYAYFSQVGISNALFAGNSAGRGGALHIDSGSFGVLDNAIFADNEATIIGGGIRTYAGGEAHTECALRHCTLTGNQPDGLAASNTPAVSLTNCIAYGNGSPQISPDLAVAFSDVQGGYLGTGNVDADPHFRDPAAFDFHLTVDSTGTVVDAGTDAGLTNDCVFRVRPLGAAPDMGAFEYNAAFDDSDGDGIPDEWERGRGLDARDPADGPAHGDGDGRSNFEEYCADTDPLDTDDFFHLTDCAYNPDRPDRGIFVGFTSSSNRLYNLYSVAALSNGCVWAAMAGKTNYPGVGNYDGFNDTNAPFDGLARTYRVTVRPIPE